MVSLSDLPVHVRLLIKRQPLLYRVAKRLTGRGESDHLCDRRTDLCIEGYPSSGNSFSFAVLHLANGSLRIAHHCHSVANLQIALDYDIPAVCLIRAPEDAIASRMARFGGNLRQAILEYIDFYDFVLDRENRLLITTFDEVTRRTAVFLDRVAQTSGLSFPVEDIASLEKRAIHYIENWTKKKGDMDKISLPSGTREKSKSPLREKIRGHPRFQDARNLWEQLSWCPAVSAATPQKPTIQEIPATPAE